MLVGVGDGGGGVTEFRVTTNCTFLSASTMLCCPSLSVPGIVVKLKNPFLPPESVPIF